MSFYRTSFPHASVTPKMHMLEGHMVLWMRQWTAGFGTMGEQGAESIHANFNGIERSFANMIHNCVDRLQRDAWALPQDITRQHLFTPSYKKKEEVSARDPSRESHFTLNTLLLYNSPCNDNSQFSRCCSVYTKRWSKLPFCNFLLWHQHHLQHLPPPSTEMIHLSYRPVQTRR
jgi:hypothetical protein